MQYMYIKLLECLAVIMCFDVCCVQWLCTYVRVMPSEIYKRDQKQFHERPRWASFCTLGGGGGGHNWPRDCDHPPPFPKGPGGAHKCLSV